jgi:transcriptional regulator with XRE-family HTH domain
MEDWKQRLRTARENKGLSKTAFAAAVGISNATATDWEKSIDAGGIKEISGPKLTKASEVLGIDPHWLLHGKMGTTSRQSANEVIEHAPGRGADQVDKMLKTVVEMVETYRLASPTDRLRIDLAVREARDNIDAINETKSRA